MIARAPPTAPAACQADNSILNDFVQQPQHFVTSSSVFFSFPFLA
jgi:hypothetical protein